MQSEEKDPGEMTAGELEEHLSVLKIELEDLEEERMFVLGQTGMHISASVVKNFDGQRETLTNRIAEGERLLKEKSK